MTDQGRLRSARMSAYAAASSYLALLSDLALKRMVDQAQSLMEVSKQTPYPRAELERIRARAGQALAR